MAANPFKSILRRYRTIFLIFVLVPIFILIAFIAVDPGNYANSDFFTFWLSGHLTILGKDPYLSQLWIGGHNQFGAKWIPDPNFTYPFPVAILFAPLGLLPLYQAFIVWVTLSELMIISSAVLLFKLNASPITKYYIFPLLAGLALYRPTYITFSQGQLSGLLLFLMTLTVYLWEKGRWWQGSIFLPYLALKPNIGVPIIVFLSLYLLLQKQIKALLAEAASGLVLVLAACVQNPSWIIEFWHVGSAKLAGYFGYSPTIWGISSYLCNFRVSCSLSYGGWIAILFLIGTIYLVSRSYKVISPTLAVCLAVTVTLLVTPYTWPYDQLLLVIPIMTITLRLAKSGSRFLPNAIIFLGIDIAAFILLEISFMTQLEIWAVAIPLCVFGLLAWFLTKDKMEEPKTVLGNGLGGF
ncbi:MAG: glycosyltransferase family 87 protein [Anaerolineaceae bacterium]|nr:glycosyltransferase family 87 protein [Anaerolineaceae bacterium]